MNHAVDDHAVVDDKTAMRRLGVAIVAMCVGALAIVVIAIAVGHLH